MILIIQAGLLKHCHNKRKDSLEKRLYRNLYVILKVTERLETPGITF